MRKLIIKDYIVRKGLEFNFKINCLAFKSIGGRKEEYPCMHVCVCMYIYIQKKKKKNLPKVLNQTIFYHLKRSYPPGV